MSLKRLGTILLITTSLVACSTVSEDPSAVFKGQSEQQIFKAGEVQLSKANYSDAVKHFEALDALYPFGPTAKKAQFDSIYAYYMSGDAASTVAAADRFIHLYPRDEHVDYAYYLRGLANFNLHRDFLARYLELDIAQRDISIAKKAYEDFASLVHFFPHSRYAPDARQHMIYLRNRMASYELQIAQFYLKRLAYVAAVNRANEIVKKYPETTAVEDALIIMVQANRALHLETEANEALKVLKHNYPNAKV